MSESATGGLFLGVDQQDCKEVYPKHSEKMPEVDGHFEVFSRFVSVPFKHIQQEKKTSQQVQGVYAGEHIEVMHFGILDGERDAFTEELVPAIPLACEKEDTCHEGKPDQVPGILPIAPAPSMVKQYAAGDQGKGVKEEDGGNKKGLVNPLRSDDECHAERTKKHDHTDHEQE